MRITWNRRKIAVLGTSVPVTLVMDNVRYQRSALVQDLAKELNIELLFLPSYSPNLNRIERLWKFVKKEVLNSRPHQDFKRFQDAIDRCLADLPTKPPRETDDTDDPQLPNAGSCVTSECVKNNMNGEFEPCPRCTTQNAQKVTFTWWGGLLGPKMFNHVKCLNCGKTFNGESGESNTLPIALYLIISNVVVLTGLILLYMYFLK